MTPEQYQRVKIEFAHAIRLPDSEREEFVNRVVQNDLLVGDELRSLLVHHLEETIVRNDVPVSVSVRELSKDKRGDDFETCARDEIQTPQQAKPTSHAVSAIVPVNPVAATTQSGIELSVRFANSTRLLLRNRLLIAVGLLVTLQVVATIVGLVMQTAGFNIVLNRFLTVSTLVVLAALLYRGDGLGLSRVRLIELIIVGVPIVELMVMMWNQTNEFVQLQELQQIPVLHAMMCSAVSLYIALYGTFIPSNWRRTAWVTVAIACTPLVVSEFHREFNNSVTVIEPMHYVNVMITLMMAGIATAGAHVVHRVRRAAATARAYGQYQLVEEIGRGGMGVVYRAEHRMLKRPAAIKLIRLESAGNPDAISQFEQEVQISATLTHWNTVQVYDFGTTERGDFYFVMEHLVGESLKERLEKEKRLSVTHTLRVVRQICQGLSEAHARDFVHRDIKPGNIFLAELGGHSDVVKILDFGLAVSRAQLTDGKKRDVCGTPAYMSPEQIRAETLDGRSDVYAIGCLMHECLTGAPPFTAKSMTNLLSQHLFEAYDSRQLVGIDQQIIRIVERCIAKPLSDRFQSVDELCLACESDFGQE